MNDEFRYPDGKTPRQEANDSMKMLIAVSFISIAVLAFVAGAIYAAAT